MNNKSLFFSLLLASCCLLLGGCSQDSLPGADRVTVGFSASGVGGEATTRADAPLVAGTTLRVLAYRHMDDNTLKADAYMGESSYTVQADGTLKADASEMQLPSGSYDFYTVMPALSVDHSGDAPTVSVDHLTDYAVSQTSAASVSLVQGGGTQQIALTALERKCSLLAFQLDVSGAKINNEPLTEVVITEVTVTGMADGPLTATGIADLSATAFATPVVMDGSRFITDKTTKTLSTGEGVFLPKSAGNSCGLKLSAYYNGDKAKRLNLEVASLPTTEFKKGVRYTFVAYWYESVFRVSLQAEPWTSIDNSTNMGE